jgi:hypothetical protein
MGATSNASSSDVVEAMLPADMIADGDRPLIREKINDFVDHLFGLGERDYGDLAICWMMMTADPRVPTTFNRFMPQLARLCEAADDDAKARLEVWWRAAAGEMVESKVSIFMIAYTEVDGPMKPISRAASRGFTSLMRKPPPLPNTVVVMATAPDTLQSAWKPFWERCRSSSPATSPASAVGCMRSIRTRSG